VSALIRPDHRVKEPNFTGAHGEADAEIFFVVERSIEPDVREDLLLFGEDEGACASSEPTLEVLGSMAKSLKGNEVSRRGPAGSVARSDRRWRLGREQFENPHVRITEECCGKESMYSQDQRVPDAHFANLSHKSCPRPGSLEIAGG
jgi:hypothetical protein